jgi:hypothetical protein
MYPTLENEIESEHRGPIEGKNKGVLGTCFVNPAMPLYGPH